MRPFEVIKINDTIKKILKWKVSYKWKETKY